MGLKELCDAVLNLQEILRTELHIGADLIARPTDDYHHIKELAVTYELQEYLAKRGAVETNAGLMEPNAFERT